MTDNELELDESGLIKEIRKIAKQGSPLKPKRVPESPVLGNPEKAVTLSKEDFETLIDMAKISDKGKGVEMATPMQTMQSQKDIQQSVTQESVQRVEPHPNLGIASMDYGNVLNRPTVLYFDTDRTCKLIQPKINQDGSVEIGDRTFDFSEGQPSILNMGSWGRKKNHPFYIIKYSSMKPIDIANDYPDTVPTPEQASRLVELGTLNTLAKIPSGKVKRSVLILIMGVSAAIGAVSVYMMSMFGII